MTNREKIEFLYKEDGIRDKQFLNTLIHYDFKLDNILTFFHYHPSTWQLHVHFMNVSDKKTRSATLPRAHSSSLVIQNLELIDDYYKKVNLEILDYKN